MSSYWESVDEEVPADPQMDTYAYQRGYQTKAAGMFTAEIMQIDMKLDCVHKKWKGKIGVNNNDDNYWRENIIANDVYRYQLVQN